MKISRVLLFLLICELSFSSLLFAQACDEDMHFWKVSGRYDAYLRERDPNTAGPPDDQSVERIIDLGDVDKDGFPDVLVKMKSWVGEDAQAYSFVISGKTKEVLKIHRFDEEARAQAEGYFQPEWDDPLGSPPLDLIPIGDFNGDGIIDYASTLVEVGSNFPSTLSPKPLKFLFRSGVDGATLHSIVLDDNLPGSSYRNFKFLGDLNGDGFPEIGVEADDGKYRPPNFVQEDGTIVLVGATTENPSFELNAAILSRAQVLELRRLTLEDLDGLLHRIEEQIRPLPLTSDARETLIAMADGDGRTLHNLAEQVLNQPGDTVLDTPDLTQRLNRRAPVYDKSGDGHYNLISALHKSVRGSDPDAALYWLTRMLEGGEDPRFLARRITRMAVEDIGLADPQAMNQCIAAWQTYERLGSPEGELALAQAVIYLSLAPKSNAAYVAYKGARRAAAATGSEPPPKHILNAPTRMMKGLGYGDGYQYDHDAEDGFSGQDYFPETMDREAFYQPVERGYERELMKRVQYFSKLRAERSE